ncbi:ABC transporter permease [Gryllotalpicola reticulitermitis]|uniref:ABC transporter permease n=1 Tax=Gryllotalpicola reticulitermitis TaxID=1184153 RepID=A0ABV8Q905_9MICO
MTSNTIEAVTAVPATTRSRRSGSAVLRSLLRNPTAVFGAVVVIIIVLATLFAGVIAPFNPDAINLNLAHAAPGHGHLLGTDLQGRDVLSRLLYAGRASLLIGVGAVVVSLVIGVPLGALAGFFGGWLDAIISRVTDVVLSFPVIVLAVVAGAVLGSGIWSLIVLLGCILWTTICRLVRSIAIAQRDADYVVAARSLGASDLRIIVKHILPSTVGVIVVNAVFGVANVILIEASLSFLGLGVRPPTPSWGNMLSDAQSLGVLAGQPWMWVPPAATILLTIVSINFLGDGMQKALDPRLRNR